MAKSVWRKYQEELLIQHYKTLTIQELQKMLGRSADSINAKIKRLKAEGKLDGYKDEETVDRALKQRRAIKHEKTER